MALENGSEELSHEAYARFDERGPDENLRFQFEATARLSDVRCVLECVLLAHDVKRWAA